MTFYEAAVRVLEREGKPLHVNAITEIALKENFLSHVGKSPEEVMQSERSSPLPS
jgi:ribonuclease E